MNIVLNTINKMVSKDNIYLLKDNTDDDYFQAMINDKNSLSRIKNLYNFICKEFKVNSFVANNKFSFITDDNRIKNGLEKQNLNEKGENLKEYSLLMVDKNFFRAFSIHCDDGKLFSDNDFVSDNGGTTNILLGADYKGLLKVNDILTDYYGKKYKVIGFIEHSAFYIDPLATKDMLLLNKTILIPQVLNKNSEFADYDSAIFSTYLMTADYNNILKIKQYSAKLNLNDIDSVSFTSQAKVIAKSTGDEIEYYGVLLFLLLLFSLIGTISHLLLFISNHKREFAINMLCGASNFSIVQRLSLQVFIIMIIAVIPVIIIFGINLNVILVILMALLTGIIILAYPVYTLLKENIITVIRRYQI